VLQSITMAGLAPAILFWAGRGATLPPTTTPSVVMAGLDPAIHSMPRPRAATVD